MIYHLALECIGEGGGIPLQVRGAIQSIIREYPSMRAALYCGPTTRAWVARITAIHDKHISREFMPFKKDYLHSNGTGSRGAQKHYFLDDGLYEISEPKSWSHTDRYFAIIKDATLRRVSREEAETWLSGHSV